jgi:hypothetical protein
MRRFEDLGKAAVVYATLDAVRSRGAGTPSAARRSGETVFASFTNDGIPFQAFVDWTSFLGG